MSDETHDETNDGPRDRYHLETRLIHGRMRSPHWDYSDHIVPPISSSSAYRLETAQRGAEGFLEFANPEFNREEHPPIYIYDRLDEPSRGMLEENLALAEGGESCVTFATGMAAISAALGVLLKPGDTVVSHKTIYGCTFSLFANWYPRLGIRVRLLDLRDIDGLRRVLDEDPNVMAVYCETIANPTLELMDLEAIAQAVAERNPDRPPRRRIFTVVDNTFATPLCCRPIEHGIDLVVHSLTKNIGGFGTDMGGAVIGPKLLEPDLLLYRKDFGGVLSPKAAWPALVHGLPTLAIRLRKQLETARRVADFLVAHPRVDKVVWPGHESYEQRELADRLLRDPDGNPAASSLIYFTLRGDVEQAKKDGARFMDTVAREALTVTLAVSLGQVRTLIEHPASMTHAPIPVEDQLKAGIDPGGIRLSMGLERPEDILADLERAFAAI